jgi:hypothetical protein
MRPAIQENAIVLARQTTALAAAADAADLPAFVARVPAAPPHGPLTALAAAALSPSPRAAESHYQAVARRRLAAAALAARLYALDQDGQLPATLDDLVPKYLPHVPADPLAAGGKPISYIPTGPRPRVYSVGPNGVDDGGRAEDPTASRAQNRLHSDLVIDLTRQPRETRTPEDEKATRGADE